MPCPLSEQQNEFQVYFAWTQWWLSLIKFKVMCFLLACRNSVPAAFSVCCCLSCYWHPSCFWFQKPRKIRVRFLILGFFFLHLIEWKPDQFNCSSNCCQSIFCFRRGPFFVIVCFSQSVSLQKSEAVTVRGGDDICVTHRCAVGRFCKCLCLHIGGHTSWCKFVFMLNHTG